MTPRNDSDNWTAVDSHDNDNGGLTFISMFSGIEAASVAFSPLRWKCLAVCEIDKAASRLLAHHYPDVPNLGDMSKVDWLQYRGKADIVCGGPPCQAFSVAGLRESLNDSRGNLSLVYMKALHAIKPRNAIVENVPGWLNTPDNAFGCFLAGLVGADDALPPPNGTKWPDAGMVDGPKGRAAWRVQDAQFHGLAQRRKRVLVVADFGNGADPAEVLFERVSVPWDPPARGKAGEGVACFSAGSIGGYRESSVSGPDRAAGGDIGGGSENLAIAYAPEIARCDATREGSSQDYESTTMVACVTGNITHTLKAEGADASEDGTGRGTPIVAATLTASYGEQSGQDMMANGKHAVGHICFTAKDYGADAQEDIAPTLRAGGHKDSHQNGGVGPAVTVAIRGREGGATAELGGEVATALRASQGGGDKPYVLAECRPINTMVGLRHNALGERTGLGIGQDGDPAFTLTKEHAHAVQYATAVRRLTPRECERLQGFPEVKETLCIEAWKHNSSDLQASYANAATQNRKSQKSASNAGESELLLHANLVAATLSTRHPGHERRAVLNAHINLERNVLRLHSAERSNWSVSIAEHLNPSLLPIPVADFVRLIAHTFTIQGLIIRSGKAESQTSINPSSRQSHGNRLAVPYGPESAGSASDAMSFITAMDAFMKSTTLEVGQNIQSLEQRLQISLSFVTSVISSCIPAGMLSGNSFDLNIEGFCGYTYVPVGRGKWQADGPRYKQLGNSWAVPKFTWLGRRIQRVMPVAKKEQKLAA
jgi:DNA (cytosine-5)-methyltransferase 1